MEIIRGKDASFMDSETWAALVSRYNALHVDIGTGDGHFVHHMAAAYPAQLVIGLDACRENLGDASRRAPANALFVIANAQALPPELRGRAQHITINFPWGSLLEGLLTADSPVMTGLFALMQRQAVLEVRLNAGAVAEAGWDLEHGSAQVRAALAASGLTVPPACPMTAADLKHYPTTWAKRLAFGRDPRAVVIRNIVI